MGCQKLRIELGDEYIHKIYKAFTDGKGQPYFCVFWFKKLSDLLDEKPRAGLVASNSISQVSGKKASLDYLVMVVLLMMQFFSRMVWRCCCSCKYC